MFRKPPERHFLEALKCMEKSHHSSYQLEIKIINFVSINFRSMLLTLIETFLALLYCFNRKCVFMNVLKLAVSILH